MKISQVIRTYGGLALSYLQEDAMKRGDELTASMLQCFESSDTLHAIADALESTEERREITSRGAFIAGLACSFLYHGEMDADEAVQKVIEVMHLSEQAAMKQVKKQT